MKKLVILSDTHGRKSAIEKIKTVMDESDFVIHLGDYQRDIAPYALQNKGKVLSVAGNCDGGGDDLVTEIDGVKILLTHGDRYGVKSGLIRLLYKAKEIGVNAVFFGHTHRPIIEEIDGITFINPGNTTVFSEKTYCYAVIYDKKITAKIVVIE